MALPEPSNDQRNYVKIALDAFLTAAVFVGFGLGKKGLLLSGAAAVTQALLRSFVKDNNRKASDGGVALLAKELTSSFKRTLYEAEIADLASSAHADATAQAMRLIREDGDRRLRRSALEKDLNDVEEALQTQRSGVTRLADSDMIMQGSLPAYLFAQRTYLMLLKEAHNIDMQVRMLEAAETSTIINPVTESGYLSDLTTEKAYAVVRFVRISKLLAEDLSRWHDGVGSITRQQDAEDSPVETGVNPKAPIVLEKPTWRWRVYFPFTAPVEGAAETRPWQVEGRGDVAYGDRLFAGQRGGGKIYRREFRDRVTRAWALRLGYPQTPEGFADAGGNRDPAHLPTRSPRVPAPARTMIDNRTFQDAYAQMWESMQAGLGLLTPKQQTDIAAILAVAK
ncbi:MAG: hypothetical protein RLP09_43130 [Sandaracinaceae bacterium]